MDYKGVRIQRLDGKDRVGLPYRFREKGARWVTATKDRSGRPCVLLMTEARWNEMKKTVKGDAALRLFLAWSEDIHIDKACRIQLRPRYRDLMEIEGNDVLFVGAGDMLEMWNPKVYEETTGVMLDERRPKTNHLMEEEAT